MENPSGEELPGTYVVVENNEHMLVRQMLVYFDGPPRLERSRCDDARACV
jgi:hypothetical protein